MRRSEVRPCACCGIVTRSSLRVCRQCQDIGRYPDPAPEDALTNGRWVLDPVRRIQVWRAA